NGHYRDGECIEVDDWSDDFDAGFLAHFTSIRGFHSCRTFGSLDHYKRRGIQKLSRTLLRQIAHAAFAGHAGPDEIDRAVDNRTIPASEKSVFLFTDSAHPLEESQTPYLHSGSEMLQALAIDL